MKRIGWIDFARVIAVILVVLCHCTESVYSFNSPVMSTYSTQSKLFAYSAFTLGRVGVPIFLMITGYLMLDREFNLSYTKRFSKNIIHLFACTEVWIVVAYCIWSINNSFSITGLLKQLLFLDIFKQNHFWYMPMILECYICIPFISCALAKMDELYFRILLILMIIVLFVVPTFSVILNMFGTVVRSQFGLGSFSIYWVYLLIGYYVKKNKNLLSMRKSFYFFVMFFWVCVLMQLINNPNGIVYTIWYNNFFLLICSSCVFICLSQIKYKNNEIIQGLARESFGVYLVHNTILHGIRPLVYKLHTVLPIKVLCLLSIVLFISFIVVKLLSTINIGSYILYIDNKSMGK